VSAFLSLPRAPSGLPPRERPGGERLARYSFLGREPIGRLEVRGGQVVVHDASGTTRRGTASSRAAKAPLVAPAEIPGLPGSPAARRLPDLDAARLFERIPTTTARRRARSPRSPSTTRSWPSTTCGSASSSWPSPSREPRRLRARAAGPRRLRGGPRWERRPRDPPPSRLRPSAHGRGAFREAVLAAKEHIAAGDIFQVVLSRQHTVDCGIDPFTVYARCAW